MADKSGKLISLRITSKSASPVFILYFNRSTPATDGLVPDSAPIPIAANGYHESDTEFHFSKGLQIHASSTDNVLTAIASADVWFTAHFEK